MNSRPLLFVYGRKKVDNKEFTILQYMWASTALALLIALPLVGMMLYFHFNFNNLLLGTILGFMVHTAVLLKSRQVSAALVKLVSV